MNMSRLRNKIIASLKVSDDVLWKLIECYNNRLIELAKTRPELQRLNTEDQKDLLENYLPESLDTVRNTLEYDFLFNRIDDLMTELCNENFDNIGTLDIIIDDYISDKKRNN